MQLELEHPTDATKIVPAKANEQGALLVAFAGEAPATATVQPTQLLGALLVAGENYMWPNILSVTVINNAVSTGNITLNAVGDAIVVAPGESIGWDAATSSVLSTLTITVPAGTTGRMFGTRYAPVVIEGA